MRLTNPRLAAALVAALLGPLALPTSARADERRFQLTIDSDLQVKYVGQNRAQAIAARTRLDYRLADRPGERDVFIDGVEVRVGSGAASLIESRMSRGGARFRLGEQEPARYSNDSAPPALKRVLEEFGQTAATIQLDPTGAVNGRIPRLGPESTLVQNGAIDNALIFHPPFPDSTAPWRAPARLSMSGGQFAAGELNYEKVGEGPDGTVRVQVVGELVAEGKIQGGEIRKGLFKVRGEQFYDPVEAAWTSGHLTIDVSFDLVANGPSPGVASGQMILSFKAIPVVSVP